MVIVDVIREYIKSDVNLNDQEKLFLYKMTQKTPELFHTIMKNIYKIIKNEKLDIHDIPRVIFIISKALNEEDFVCGPDITYTSLIRFLIDSILESGILPFPKFEMDVVIRIINSSIDLLELNMTSKKKKSKYFFC